MSGMSDLDDEQLRAMRERLDGRQPFFTLSHVRRLLDALEAERARVAELEGALARQKRPAALDRTPEGTEICYLHRGVVIVLGRPDPEDESHNCDAMGCGSFGPHVTHRIPLARVAKLEAALRKILAIPPQDDALDEEDGS